MPYFYITASTVSPNDREQVLAFATDIARLVSPHLEESARPCPKERNSLYEWRLCDRGRWWLKRGVLTSSRYSVDTRWQIALAADFAENVDMVEIRQRVQKMVYEKSYSHCIIGDDLDDSI